MSRYNLSSELQKTLKETASVVAGVAVAAGTFYALQDYGIAQELAELAFPQNPNASYMDAHSKRHVAEFAISSLAAGATGLLTYTAAAFER